MNNVPRKLLNQSWEEQRRQKYYEILAHAIPRLFAAFQGNENCLAVVTGYNKITINQLAAYATYKQPCGTYCLVCAIKDKK